VLGPIAAGLLLDLVDFATYGPVGLYAGLIVGGAAGYLLALAMGVRLERRWGYALAAGLYCMLPFTAFLPVATLVGALIRLREKDLSAAEPPAAADPPPALEAEYESSWDRD
jgi:hypothetical protein